MFAQAATHISIAPVNAKLNTGLSTKLGALLEPSG